MNWKEMVRNKFWHATYVLTALVSTSQVQKLFRTETSDLDTLSKCIIVLLHVVH